MKPRIHESNKLHHGNYLYKIKIRNELGYLLRKKASQRRKQMILSGLQEQYDDGDKDLRVPLRFYDVHMTRSEYQDFKWLYEYLNQNSDDRLVRVENRAWITISTDSLQIIDDIRDNIGGITDVYIPKSDNIEFLKCNINKVIVKKQPEYRYRVYLNNKPIDQSLYSWLQKNSDKAHAGSQLMYNLENGWNSPGCYFYVDSEKVLTMIRMIIGKNIRKVEELVYQGNIDKYIHDNTEPNSDSESISS